MPRTASGPVRKTQTIQTTSAWDTPCAVAMEAYVGHVRVSGGALSLRDGGMRAVQKATVAIKSAQAVTFIPTPVTETW